VLPDQPADPPLAVRRDTPATHGAEPSTQPALAALAPMNGSPLALLSSGDHQVGAVNRSVAFQRHGEVAAHGNNILLLAELQASQEVRVVAVVRVGGDAGMADAHLAGGVEQIQSNLGLGLEGDLLGDPRLEASDGVLGPLPWEVQPS